MTSAAACRPSDVVITGLGTVNPLGGDVDSTWSVLRQSTCAIRPLEHDWVEAYDLPVRIGAPLAVDPADLLPPRQLRRLDRASQCALLAARQAWEQAGAPQVASQRLAVSVSPGMGPVLSVMEAWDTTIREFQRHCIVLDASCDLAIERGETFVGFEDSAYASGEFFEKYVTQDFVPVTERVKEIFAASSVHVPTREDWAELAEKIKKGGLYNRNLQAVPPTGSISYINNSTSSIHPIVAKVEIRKEGKIGRVYYPAPFMTNDNLEYYQDAYEIGPEKIIDTYAAATQHVDQGLSLTLFFPDTATTRDVNRAQIYAWRKGIKTLYYIRLRQAALTGTEVEGCVSCML